MITEKAMSIPTIAADIERVLIGGDLAALSPDQRISYYKRVCESLGINWLTQPFGYIELWNSQLKRKVLTLYAKKDAAEQLRNLHRVSIPKLDHETVDDMYVVTAYARDEQGREDSDVGVVPLTGLAGNDRANAMLKAVTKAKRRVTLSLCGLGFLDETEVEAVRDAKTVEVTDNGEIVGTETPRYEPHEEAVPEVEKPKIPGLMSQIQRTKLIELYRAIHNCGEHEAMEGLATMFVETFKHSAKDATYTEAATITAQLLAANRQR